MTELEMEMARKMRSRTEKLGHDGECWSDEEKDRLKCKYRRQSAVCTAKQSHRAGGESQSIFRQKLHVKI